MNTDKQRVMFRINPFWRDYAVIESIAPMTCPEPLIVVGAARTSNTIVLLPLVEIQMRGDTPPGDKPRHVRLHIPPRSGVVEFKVNQSSSMLGVGCSRDLKAVLQRMGVTAAFLHAAPSGLPDDGHPITQICDVSSGKPFFHLLERSSPVIDKAGMQMVVEEAHNFMQEIDADRLLIDPRYPGWNFVKNLAVHVRALGAALEGAEILVREHTERSCGKSGMREG